MAHLEVDRSTSLRLAKIPQRDTSIEMSVRRFFHSHGLRYRIDNRDLPGSPDIANRSQRWAVFVHGCYWHHHDGCSRATLPKRNRAFWMEKFAANKVRDARALAMLEKLRFSTFVVWECEVISGAFRDRLSSLIVAAVELKSLPWQSLD